MKKKENQRKWLILLGNVYKEIIQLCNGCRQCKAE